MNCKKISMLAFALVGALLLASVASAQTKVFLGVGSSGQFPTAGIAAVSPDPVTGAAAPCGSHLWTGKNGKVGAVIEGVDPRSTGTPLVPPLEPANIWVAWDSSTAPTVVCAYVVVDSIVGVRLYSAQGSGGDWAGVSGHGNGTLHFVTGTSCGASSSCVPGTGPGLIAGFPDTDATVPCAVASFIDSNAADTCKSASPVGYTVGMTDIRPEDAQYAMGRAGVTFGYNPGGLTCGPNPVLSSYSATNAQVCVFSISGSDPISGLAVPAFQTYSFGAAPEVIMANNNGNMGASGCVFPTNILAKTAAKLWAGAIGTSQQAFGPGVCNTQLAVNQREPNSGTYNTFEFQLVHARDGNSSDTQEVNTVAQTPIVGNPPAGNCPTPPAAFSAPYTCTNPLVLSSGQNSIRFRALGSGEMVNSVNGTVANLPPYADRLGYNFYSLGAMFSSADANVRYFTLQGVDPLYSNYDTAGAFGTCSGSIPAGTFQCTTKLPNFAHVADGSYRVWTVYRWMAPPSLPATDIRMQVLTAGQDQAHYALNNPSNSGENCSACTIKAIADFIPPQDFKLFRSHYALGAAGIVPADANNGTNSPSSYCAADQTSPNCVEEGGDMAGVPYFIITDQQLYSQTGNEEITNIE